MKVSEISSYINLPSFWYLFQVQTSVTKTQFK